MKKLMITFLIIACSSFGLGNYSLQLSENYKVVGKSPRGDWIRLRNQTVSVGILSVATLGTLYVFRENLAGWDFDVPVKELGQKWRNNIKSAPSWDRSSPLTNYIGHPYVGAAYYMAARKSDFNQFDSFLYSAVLSTFLWEYGVEAYFEIPSMQDIITTPIFGSMLGEYFYNQESRIIEKGGKLMGSRFLGKTTLILLDPIGTFANKIGFKDDRVTGSWIFSLDDSGKVNAIGITVMGSI